MALKTAVAPKLLWNVRLDATAFSRQIEKELIGISHFATELRGDIVNIATIKRNGRLIALFPFIDKGTNKHLIIPHDTQDSEAGVLWNPLKSFGPVRREVHHPGFEGVNISARTSSHFSNQVQELFYGSSDIALEEGTTISLRVIRRVFVAALLDAKKFAESITPSKWHQVRDSYLARFNGRKVENAL